MKPQIRRIVIQVEEIHQEIGLTIDPPARKVTVAAVIKNLYAGKYVDDLELEYVPEKGLIELRSASRIGISDMGVNKKRVEDLLYRLSLDEIK